MCGVNGRRFNALFKQNWIKWSKTMSLWSLTDQQSVFKRYHSKKHMRVLPTKWRRKPAGIDMERNYVTVTLCFKLFFTSMIVMLDRVCLSSRWWNTSLLCTWTISIRRGAKASVGWWQRHPSSPYLATPSTCSLLRPETGDRYRMY